MKHWITAGMLIYTSFALAQPPQPSAVSAQTLPNPVSKNAEIVSVKPMGDRFSVLVHYQINGQTFDRRITFPKKIVDYQFCRWLGSTGVAVAASVKGHEVYYATAYLDGANHETAAVKVPAPKSNVQLMDITNPGGDTLVITAGENEPPRRLEVRR